VILVWGLCTCFCMLKQQQREKYVEGKIGKKKRKRKATISELTDLSRRATVTKKRTLALKRRKRTLPCFSATIFFKNSLALLLQMLDVRKNRREKKKKEKRRERHKKKKERYVCYAPETQTKPIKKNSLTRTTKRKKKI